MKTFMLWMLLLDSILASAQYNTSTSRMWSLLSYQEQPAPSAGRYHPAGYARWSNPVWSVSAEQPYQLKELTGISFLGAHPFYKGNVRLQYYHSSSPGYRYGQIGLGYARSLGKTFLGTQVSYSQQRIDGYTPHRTWTMDIGIQHQVQEHFIAGVQVTNLSSQQGLETFLNRYYSLGGGYQISDACYVALEMVRDGNGRTYWQNLIAFQYNEKIFSWLGFHAGHGGVMGGVGWQMKPIRVDVQVGFHPYLGWTPGVGVHKIAME
jgi:hypothetical protein